MKRTFFLLLLVASILFFCAISFVALLAGNEPLAGVLLLVAVFDALIFSYELHT